MANRNCQWRCKLSHKNGYKANPLCQSPDIITSWGKEPGQEGEWRPHERDIRVLTPETSEHSLVEKIGSLQITSNHAKNAEIFRIEWGLNPMTRVTEGVLMGIGKAV